MTRSIPFVLEGSISVDAKMLIFADSLTSAAEQLEAKTPQIREFLEKQLQDLALAAMMDPASSNEKLLHYFDVREAAGSEVAGSEALKPDEITLETCDHEDHDHEQEG